MRRAEKKFYQTLKDKLKNYQPASNNYSGYLGNGDGVVTVPGIQGYVYIRRINGEVVVAFNNRVPNEYGTPVFYGYDPVSPGLFQVLSRRPVRIPGVSTPPEVADHDHTWPSRLTTWVRGEQFLPALVQAKGGMIVCIYPFHMRRLDGSWIYISYTEIDLTDHVPDSGAIAALISFDDNGDLLISDGDVSESIEAISEADIPITDNFSVAAVRLYAGMVEIRQEKFYTDIFDLRFGRNIIGGATWGKIQGRIEDQTDLLVFSGGHTHGTMRWLADGGTTYNLPDFASSLLAVYSAGSRVDPTTVELSSDGAQVIFSVGPTAGNVLVSDYIIRSA